MIKFVLFILINSILFFISLSNIINVNDKYNYISIKGGANDNINEKISRHLFDINKETKEFKCEKNPNKQTYRLNNYHFRGTALGGWLVLEPWITPSLFYQFLGASDKWGDDAPKKVAVDSSSFCIALGKEEANKQLRRHWKTWVTEDEIKFIAISGLDTIRIPVGDWMYIPYEPYIGCMDGALEELERVLRLCEKYNLKVVLDIHAIKGSQNGLDNSGTTVNFKWTGVKSRNGSAHYDHWDIRGAEWIGNFDGLLNQYRSINYTNIEHSLNVVKKLVKLYANEKVIIGLEPVNEPWWPTPIDVLKEFYWDSYQIVQELAPHWVTVFHDSFRLNADIWSNFMTDCDNWAIDTHLYQAWAFDGEPDWFIEHACLDGDNIRLLESLNIPVIVGEWSLATDNCAMWLNGFNDNIPGYPKVECERIQCPDPYMGKDQPNAPPNKELGIQDPFGGGGKSFVEYGTCPRDKPFNDDDVVMKKLALSKLNSYDTISHGNFFWNFRTEFEPRWNYRAAVDKGWIPSNYNSTTISIIESICKVNIPIPALDALVIDSNNNNESNYILMISIMVIIFIIFYNWKYSMFSYQLCNKKYQYNKIIDKEILEYDEEDSIEIIDRK